MHVRVSTASFPPGGEAFPRARRIGARRDFREAYESGVKHHGRLVVVFARPRSDGGLRLGITATRKTGDAVRRNGARRRVREIFRRWCAKAPDAAADLVVNISASATRAPYAALEAELTRLLGRATVAPAAAAATGPGSRGVETK